MRSVENLTKEDLSRGKLPEKMYEIAVYSSNKNILGKKLKIYLYDQQYMGHSSNVKELASQYWRQTITSMFDYGGIVFNRNLW